MNRQNRQTTTPRPARRRTAARKPAAKPTALDASLLRDDDLHLFNEGTHGRLHERLGAHPAVVDGTAGTFFGVWAPASPDVSLIGDFNDWQPTRLRPRDSSGIWEGFLPGAKPGDRYKYRITTPDGHEVDKSDPVGFRHEAPPGHASLVTDLSYDWGDADWMETRRERNALDAPVSAYEVHLGSWRRVPEDGHRMLSYRELTAPLADHAVDLGFTHVELMPVMEHPFYGSWGYQTTGYFAPTHRYGSPQDLMHLVDTLHQRGVGVILDWVPSHFPDDPHGLGRFDGTHLYEHRDPRRGYHPDWKSLVFNYGRHEVRSFLLSSALYWLDRYHADGLRVDGVASMLYLDYSRGEGEWVPNQYGGREDLDAIHFLRSLNEHVYQAFPDVQTIAEESTAWPMVSRPTYLGGLGFGLKWDMGWMHDTLRYMARDPVHRRHHHNELSFRLLYAFQENFMLPLSHDEVVHGKGSLFGKMPGDDWQRFANLRLLYGYQWTQPGKKLLFMGCEFAQHWEWDHDHSLPWHLLQYEGHAGVMRLVRDLNRLQHAEPSLHRLDHDPAGFEWIDASDAEQSVLSYLRLGGAPLLVVLNLTPVVRHHHRIGVPAPGRWEEVLNTDARDYGGSGVASGAVTADEEPAHGRAHSVELTLPPLAAVVLRGPGGGAGRD